MSRYALDLISKEISKKSGILDLGKCGLTESDTKVWDAVKKMTWLHTLILSNIYWDRRVSRWIDSQSDGKNNYFTKLPDCFDGLSKLKKLILCGLHSYYWDDFEINDRWKIKHFENLKQLRQLIYLDIGYNEVEDISFLRHLDKIEYLYLDDNKIKDIEALGALEELKTVSFKRNEVTNLAVLANKRNIDYLNFEENKIGSIHPLKKMIFEDRLSLDDEKPGTIRLKKNPLVYPPIEIINQGKNAVLKYFEEIENKKSKINNEVKLILLGNSTSGKTSLSLFLREKLFNTRQSTTHGGDLNKKWSIAGKDLNVNIWDFGGQEYYHSTHRLFLSSNSVIIVVWDASTDTNGFVDTPIFYDDMELVEPLEHFPHTYWISTSRHYASGSPLLVVQNKCDKNDFDVKRVKDETIRKYELDLNKVSFQISLLKAFNYFDTENDENKFWNFKFNDFEQVLINILKKTCLPYPYAEYWLEIKKVLKNLGEKQRSINLNEFEAICMEKNPDLEDDPDRAVIFNNIMTLLKDSWGSVLFFPQNPVLKDKVYLNPNNINKDIYAVFNYDIKSNNGRFSLDHVRGIFNGDNRKTEEMIALMKQFELIFEDDQRSNHFVAPQFLPYKFPDEELLETVKKFSDLEYCFSLRFPDFLKRNVIARFIARKGSLSKDDLYWKFGLLFHEGMNALVECEYGRTPIIFVSIQRGDKVSRDTMAADIFHTVKDIIGEDIPFELSLDNRVYIKWADILMHHHAKSQFIITMKESVSGNERRDISEVEHIRIDMKSYGFLFRNEGVRTVKVFTSYAHVEADEFFKRRLDKHLEPLKRSKKINLWSDESLLPGAKLSAEVSEEISAADIILLLVSADFNSSDVIDTPELRLAMKRHERGEAIIIPIYLRPVNASGLPYSTLRGFPKDGIPLSLQKDVEASLADISQEIEKVVDRITRGGV